VPGVAGKNAPNQGLAKKGVEKIEQDGHEVGIINSCVPERRKGKGPGPKGGVFGLKSPQGSTSKGKL